MIKLKRDAVGRGVELALVVALGAPLVAQEPVDEVDPTIGRVSILPEPARSTAFIPNSMVRMYPLRKDALTRKAFAGTACNSTISGSNIRTLPQAARLI